MEDRLRKAWQVLFIVLVLAWMASSVATSSTEALVIPDSRRPDPPEPLGFREEVCTGRDAVEVGIPEKPLVLPCDSADFEALYLAYCTAQEYTRLTGEESQPHIGVKEQLVSRQPPADVRETQIFLSQLRQEARQQLGSEDPPAEVDFSQHFPPAIRQMTNDCGSCAMANGVTGVQARQFALWGSPWTPEEIVSPFSFSRRSDSHDCSLTMAEPFVFWHQEGAWTNDILPYGVGDCHTVSLTAEELALGYPLHSAEYWERLFAHDDDYGYYIGSTKDVKRAVALGKNVQLVFGPLGSSDWAHTLAIMGYNAEGVMYLNSWGSNWGPNGDGTGIFTWDWLLSSEAIQPPFFSSPHRIWFYFNAAADWAGECGPAYLQYDYRGVCQVGADLAVQKIGPSTPVLVGSDVTYDIEVTNAGPDPGEDVLLTDHLPTGMDFVSASPGCSESEGEVTCPLGTMAAGGINEVQITARPTTPGQLTDVASVSGSVIDPNGFNNMAQETTEVLGQANLVVTKRDTEDPVRASEPMTWTLSVSNAGPNDARDVLIVDTLPPGASFESAVGTGWTCWEISNLVTCRHSELAADGTAQLTLVANAPAEGRTVINTAEVSSDEEDPDEANNVAQEETTVIAQADLAITKRDAVDPVAPHKPLSYYLTVSNAGPSEAVGLVVEDALPNGVAFESASGDGWTCEEALGEVRCERARLAAGAQATIVIKVTAPGDERTLVNTASVTSGTEDPLAANDTVTEPTTVSEQADLALTKVDSADPIVPGESFRYVLTASNAGPNAAVDVVVEDTLPTGVAFQAAVGVGWSCAKSSDVVRCQTSRLEPGATSTITLDVTAPLAVGQLTNAAQVMSGVYDPHLGNNEAVELTTVAPQTDLALTKADSRDPVVAGQPFSYTLTVTNAGPNPGTEVIIVDPLPPSLDVLSVSAGCWEADGTVTCTVDDLPIAGAASFGIVVNAGYAGSFTNTASVSGATVDGHTLNNTATETTDVEAQADLSIAKGDSADPVAAGEGFTYTLKIANRGPSSAPSVVVTDTLPVGVIPRVASGAGWTCAEPSGTVTCTTPSLGAGEIATITVGVDAPSSGGMLKNVAAVSSAAHDPDGSDNQCAETTAVMKLLLTTDASPDPVLPGNPLTYTLWVTNAGGVELHATVTDTLPAQVTPGGVLTWTPTIPAPHGVWTETVVVTTETGFEGSLTNVLEVVTREGIKERLTTVSTVSTPRKRVFLPLLLRDF